MALMRESQAESDEIKVINDNIVLDQHHQELVHIDSKSTLNPYDERIRYVPQGYDPINRGFGNNMGIISRANYNY